MSPCEEGACAKKERDKERIIFKHGLGGGFQMGPGWVNWTANWWDSVYRSELGESDGVFPEICK